MECQTCTLQHTAAHVSPNVQVPSDFHKIIFPCSILHTSPLNTFLWLGATWLQLTMVTALLKQVVLWFCGKEKRRNVEVCLKKLRTTKGFSTYTSVGHVCHLLASCHRKEEHQLGKKTKERRLSCVMRKGVLWRGSCPDHTTLTHGQAPRGDPFRRTLHIVRQTLYHAIRKRKKRKKIRKEKCPRSGLVTTPVRLRGCGGRG